MKSSYLVQRLTKSYFDKVDNPFAFGGGYRNGGLSDAAMEHLRPIFGFDYMGAAEFEFGAVPTAFRQLALFAESEELVAEQFEIPFTEIARSWRDEKKPETHEGTVTVYVLRSMHHDEVEVRIRGWAKEAYNRGLKESTQLASALRQEEDWDARRIGWFELDNSFMFFRDRDAWAQTSALFGVEVDKPVEV